MAVGSGGNSGAVRAGRAFVEFFLVDNKLIRGLDKVRDKFSSVSKTLAVGGGALTGLGGTVLGGLGKAVGEAVEHDVAVGKLAAKLGVGADRLSAFAYAAKQTGVTFEELEGHFENFAERVFQGAQGTGEAADSFAKLNLNAADLQQLDPVEQMVRLAGAMQGVTNETQRLGLLSSFGGDQFQKLNDLFRQGPAAIRNYMTEAGRFGAIVTDDQVQAARTLDRAWVNTLTAIKSILLEVGRAFFGLSGDATGWAAQIAQATLAVKTFIANNRGLIVGLAAGAAAVTAAGVALLGLAGAFAGASAVIGGVLAVMAKLSAAVALLFTPGGLLVAGIAAAGAALFTYTDAWQQLKDAFADTAGTIVTGWGAVVAALKGGDLSAAWKVVTAGVAVEWARLTLKLTALWGDFKAFFVDGWHDAVYLFRQRGGELVAFGLDLVERFNRFGDGIARAIVEAMKTATDAVRSASLGILRVLEVAMGGTGNLVGAALLKRAQGEIAALPTPADVVGRLTEAHAAVRDQALAALRRQFTLDDPLGEHREFQRLQAAREAARAEDAQAARDQLAAAEEGYRLAVAAANAVKAADPLAAMAGKAGAVGAAIAKEMSRGAFTGFALGQQLRGTTTVSNDLARKTLQQTEKVAVNTGKLLDVVKNASLVFAP